MRSSSWSAANAGTGSSLRTCSAPVAAMLPLRPVGRCAISRALRRGHAVGHRRGSSRPAAAHRRVPRRRHRDERPRRRRAASSRRSAPCSSAAASCTTAGRRCARCARRSRAGSSASPGSPRRWSTRRPRPRRAPRARRPRSRAACSSPTAPAFDRRVLRQAFERARARLARPAGDLHGRARPALAAARAPARLAPLAESLGIEVERSPPRARRRRDVRARVLRAVPAAVRERADGRRRAGAARPRGAARRPRATDGAPARAGAPARGRSRSRPRRRRRSPARRCPTSPASTSSATPAGSRCTSASRSPLRTRVRAHFAAVVDPRGVDGAGRERRLPARRRPSSARCVLEQRLIKRAAAAGQRRLKHERPLRLPALPARHRRSRCSRSRPSPRRGTRSTSGRCAAGRRPPSSSSSSTRCSACATAAAGCRAAMAVGVRADGALPVAVPRRPRPQPLPAPARRGAGAVHRAGDGGARAARRTSTRRCARRPRDAALRARGVAAAPPRAARLLLDAPGRRAGGDARAAAARAARRTRATRGAATRSGSWAGASPTGAPLRDAGDARRAHRGGAARAADRGDRPGTVPPDEVDEVRIVAALGRDATRRRSCCSTRPPDPGRLAAFAACALAAAAGRKADFAAGRDVIGLPLGGSRLGVVAVDQSSAARSPVLAPGRIHEHALVFMPQPDEPVYAYATRLRAMHHHLGMLIEAVERGMSDVRRRPWQARAAPGEPPPLDALGVVTRGRVTRPAPAPAVAPATPSSRRRPSRRRPSPRRGSCRGPTTRRSTRSPRRRARSPARRPRPPRRAGRPPRGGPDRVRRPSAAPARRAALGRRDRRRGHARRRSTAAPRSARAAPRRRHRSWIVNDRRAGWGSSSS